jgi:hypothetical protein
MSKEQLYSLIPLDVFKTILTVDDRDDKLCQFCLITATHTIEQHCKRRLIRKKHFERIEYTGDLLLPLREYPVSRFLSAHVLYGAEGTEELIEPDFYSVTPDCGIDYDLPFNLSFTRALLRYRSLYAFKVSYWAGYSQVNVPADLASACMELAEWNLKRYRGRRIGLTGNVRGAGKEGEHLEMSMPENVKALLEPYRRRVI